MDCPAPLLAVSWASSIGPLGRAFWSTRVTVSWFCSSSSLPMGKVWFPTESEPSSPALCPPLHSPDLLDLLSPPASVSVWNTLLPRPLKPCWEARIRCLLLRQAFPSFAAVSYPPKLNKPCSGSRLDHGTSHTILMPFPPPGYTPGRRGSSLPNLCRPSSQGGTKYMVGVK